IDRVAAVAGIPDEGIVAGTKGGHVIAATANNGVVAGATGNGVVAVAAVDGEVDLAGMQPGSVDGVVTGASVDHKRVVGGLGVVDRHLRGQSVDDDRRAAAGDADVVVAGGAIDDYAVRLAVTHGTSERPR